MCSNYEVPKALRFAELGDHLIPTFDYKAHCYPGYDAPIIIKDPEGSNRLLPVRATFGMVPHWADITLARRTYNARSETVDTKPSFKNAWKKRQTCLVPVEQFFEPSYETGKAVKWGIHRKDRRLICLAGLWEMKTLENGDKLRSFTMLTINADGHPLMERFHAPGDEKRSVVPVDERDYATWLDPETAKDMRDLLKPFDAELFTATVAPNEPRKSKKVGPSTRDPGSVPLF